jgi:hypothetical protein
MKRLASIALIAVGTLLVIGGVLGLQFVQDLMPINLPSFGDAHTYVRMVPTDPAPSPNLAPALIIAGLVAVVVGARLRRRGAD